MKRSIPISILLSLSFVVFVALLFRPVPIPSSDSECLFERGMVTTIYEAGVKDVVFILENNNKKFYINRGLERGLNLKALKEQLINKEIIVKYPDYWSPFGGKTLVHLSKLELGSRVLFSEF